MAENPRGTAQPPGHWQCGQCGYKLPGVSAVKFCPECGAKQKTEKKVIHCERCGSAFKTPDQPFCEKCLHEQKPGQGQVKKERESTGDEDQSSGNGGPQGRPQRLASETTPPHAQPSPPSLATPSKSTQQGNEATSSPTKPSPPPDPSLNSSEDESPPSPTGDDSSPHQPASPIEKDGVSEDPPPSSVLKAPIEESGAQDQGNGQLPAQKSNGKLAGEKDKDKGQLQEQKAGGQPLAQKGSGIAPGSSSQPTPENKNIYSQVFGNQPSPSTPSQKEKEKEKQSKDTSTETEGGRLKDTDQDPLHQEREGGENHSGRNTPEPKQPKDAEWSGGVDTPPLKKRRKWRKHSRIDYESDKQIISSTKRLRAHSSSDENVSYIAHDSSPSSGEEDGKLYKKPDKAGVLFGGTNKSKSAASSKDSPAEEQKNRKNPSTEQQSQKKYDYRRHSGPKLDLKGLKASKKSIAVTFHAIVPKPLWEWDDTSCMHIRFGHKDLGNWQHNVGEFKESRSQEDGFCEMTCTLPIQEELLTKHLEYKYVIFSPKVKGKDDCYEFLHPFAGRYTDPNRNLYVNKSLCEEYHQYDTVVYPRIAEVAKGLGDKFKAGVKAGITFFGSLVGLSSSTQTEVVHFKSPPKEELASQCLQFYLEPYKDVLLQDEEYPKGKVDVMVSEIAHIYSVLHEPMVNGYRWTIPLTVTMKEWLEKIVAVLQNVKRSQHQFISATCVASCLQQCHINHTLKNDFLFSLLRMLRVQPDTDKGICLEYTCFQDLLGQQSFRRDIAAAVGRLCQQGVEAGIKTNNVDWLFVLPLYHFMKKISEPFMKPEYDPEKIEFDNKLKIDRKLPPRCVNDLYIHLEPLFAADPMLLHVFIAMCPMDDYLNLFVKIPVYLSLTWISHLPKSVRSVNWGDANKWLTWLRCIHTQLKEGTQNKPQLIVASVDAALLLFSCLTAKLTHYNQHYLEVLMMSLTIILLSLSKLDQSIPDANNDVVKDVLDKAVLTLTKWITNKDVIGGSLFGGKTVGGYLVDSEHELQLWQSVLTLEIPSDKIAQRWIELNKSLIKKRVGEVPAHNVIDLVCLLEKKDVHPVLSAILMEGGCQAFDKMSTNLITRYCDRFLSMNSERVGSLFGRLLKKQYPQLEFQSTLSVSLDDLLKWSYWPSFIKIHKGSSKLKEGLPEECQVACSCAISKLEEVSRDLQKGAVTILDLQKIKENEEQMKRLCEAGSTQQKEATKSMEITYETLIFTVHQRMQEFESFRQQQDMLLHLCQKIHGGIKGVKEAKVELQKDYDSYKINTLCTRSGNNIAVICFQSASSLLLFATQFSIMTRWYNSAMFSAMWSETMTHACRSNPDLTISDVGPKVWKPAFTQCQQLLGELHSGSMTLSNVDTHFSQYRGDWQRLERELENLFRGVNDCCREHKDPAWIHQVVIRMMEYWRLCEYRKAANSFLMLRDSLELTKGDFKNVERISKEVSSSMKDQTLADIDEKLVRAGRFLSEFTGRKLECITKFSECQDIVQWIRDTTKDVGDLQNFVNVALATAAGGEDALSHDRLSNLRTVGSGFGSLIYKLRENTGFDELSQRCASLWIVLKDNPNLPIMLESCNKALEWYKSVKETQGSVEVTSFGQMNNILSYGCYTVGGERGKTVHSIHDIIHLKLEERDKQLHKKGYSLDELRDLESKLVLITGSKAENRAQVEQFLDTLHTVCRIAEVLISLQQVGNVKYIGWKMEFYCHQNLVEDLQERAKEMEEELEEWKEEVRSARNKFYELNYYTTRQLLVLRSELGKLKTPVPTPYQRARVMALLQSISCDITPSDVETVVERKIIDGEMSYEGATTDNMEFSSSSSYQPPPTPPAPANLGEDIFASIDAQNSNTEEDVSMRKAAVSVSDLDAKQLENFTNLTEKYGYTKKFALKAIEECSSGDWYEIMNWIQENEAVMEEMPQSEGEEDSEGEDQEGEGEEEEEEVEQKGMATEVATKKSKEAEVVDEVPPTASLPLPVRSKAKVVVTHKQPVHNEHSEVQLLIGAGFSKDESIRAIERWGTAAQAMEHLLAGPESDGVFGSAAPVQAKDIPVQYHTKMEKEITIFVDPDAEKKYLMLDELGWVLRELSSALPAAVPSARSFPEKVLKTGHPNLLVVAPDNVLRAALSLYMDDGDLPLPTPEEMLICNENTTSEEVDLLWQRAVCDEPHFRRVFCLVHAEKLPYQTADKALRSLNDIIQAKRGYRLVVICSNLDEEKSHIIAKLHLYRRPYVAPSQITKYQLYLKQHLISEREPDRQTRASWLPVIASGVDHERSCVRVVSSTRAGMGKSLFIIRMAEQLRKQKAQGTVIITIPIHGPHVTTDTVMECLESHQDNSYCTILHFDIAPSVLWQVDTILFSLLIQRGLCDSQGRVWRNHPSQLYAIEVTLPEPQDSTLKEKQPIPESCTMAVLDMLPLVNSVKPKDALLHMTGGTPAAQDVVLMDRQEFEGPVYQRVYQYLRRYIMSQTLDHFSFTGITEGTMENCLQIILNYCGVKDPSWAELRHFVWFLDRQLDSCEKSVFCDETFVGDVMAGLKTFVVKFMIRMSRDFATSSLRGEVAQENEEIMVGQREDDLEQYQIVERKQWEQSSHPYIFFNQDRISVTFVGFMVTRNGDLIDPAHRGVLEKSIMTQQLYTGLKCQGVNFDEDYRNWAKGVMIQKISTVMGIEWPYDPDETYVLTVDNLIKILAIQMRFRCGIPVVIMGETGCGKTRLIRFMCDLAAQGTGKGNMFIMKVHGGVTEKDIETFLEDAMEQAKGNRSRKLDTVVFFDEANTTDAIGLIKEIMCDRRLHGKPIPEDLKFIAACNPYRRHSERMIEKLRSAGLGFYVRETETQQKLGKIPLRELVYRVIDLPPSMRPLVYDFGQLNTDTERDYTHQIVSDHMKKHGELSQQRPEVTQAVARVLAWSQKYMRDRKDECSFVSLRDVERAMIVFKYFFEKMPLFGPLMDEKEEQENNVDIDGEPMDNAPIMMPAAVMPAVVMPAVVMPAVVMPAVVMPVPARAGVRTNTKALTRSLVLAVSVCYHARLGDRNEYEEGVVKQFTAPLVLPDGREQFRNEIRWCQEVLLDSMELGKNIARNAALRENIFMMAVCVDLRIPLFLVGKPGSSKSLAKTIVASSMQGQASSNDLLKSFKQVHMFSYQCSQLSTPESVIEVFHTAKRFQRNQDTTKYVSVVVLDEVGLAEDSPNLPLKALHPLLEDGTEGADDNQEVIDREKRVAFIGISNWALDPAKMNRGVMVTRGDPDTDELVLSARGICSNEDNDPVRGYLEPYFQPLAEAYAHICDHQERQFFGLRDFYSLIKMLYWMCEKTKTPLTGPQLLHAIKRNFGGLEDKNLKPVQEFLRRLPSTIDRPPDMRNVPYELHPYVNPDNTRRGLIKTSLRTKEKTWHGENRYLLFLTENYAALEILKQYLQDHEGEPSPPPVSGELSEDRDWSTLKPWEMEPFILFGSSFPKDKEYTQVCRNINQIKICMETGRTVILLNLENLYESLYDVLNQYYIYHGGSRYVDLGLQTHKVKCRVHEEFKLILIAEKTTVYEKFPTPLINRLEKHFVLTSSVLGEWQSEVLRWLQEWVEKFSDVSSSDSRFKEKDAFVGYQKDTPASVVFQASNQLHQYVREGNYVVHCSYLWVEAWERGQLGAIPHLDELEYTEDDSDQWKQAVLAVSQFLLLQTTPPAALVRLKNSSLSDQFDQLKQLYSLQHHSSIDDFLYHYITHDNSKGGLLLQVTTHSHLLSYDEVQELGGVLPVGEGGVVSFLLQEFDTELDFTSKVSPLFVQRGDEREACLLIIQCDFGHADGDLIACARYRIYDMRAKALLQDSSGLSHRTHVLFIIHLPVQAVQSSFVGFQGDPWVSCHIDELRRSGEGALTLEVAQGAAISELFYGRPRENLPPSPGVEREVLQFAKGLEEMVFHRVASREEGENMEMEEGEREEGRGGGVEDDMQVEDIEEVEEGEREEEKGEEEEEMMGMSESGEETEQAKMVQSEADSEQEEAMEEEEEEDDVEREGPTRTAKDQEAKEEEEEEEEEEEDDVEREGPTRTAKDQEAKEEEEEEEKEGEEEEEEEEKKKKEEEEVAHQTYTQCTRLNSCIQAAASKLQDSTQNKHRATKRVELLIDHVPETPSFPLNPDSFYAILVGHIHRLLKERETVHLDPNWVLKEAMNVRSLQNGGTFKNVLARKLDDVIVPIFAEIIAFLDRNCNLSLLQAGSETTPLSQFWLSMFRGPRAEQQLRYEQMVGRQKVPMAEEEFESQFPFSWLAKEAMDSQWDGAKSTAGTNRQRLHQQLIVLVQDTAVGETLSSVSEEDCEEMYRRYLHDFVRMVHKCTHRGQQTVSSEYKLITDTIHNMIVHGSEFGSMDGHMTLTNRIAAVHVIYSSICEELHWFGQLTAQYPGIVSSLTQMPPGEEGMMLHLYAVEKVLDNLKPPIEADRKTSLADHTLLGQWLHLLQLSCNTIDSTLSLPSQHPLATRARQRWQSVRVIQMFTEHVIMKHRDCNVVPFARRLQIHLGEEPDFLVCQTVDKVKQVLNSMRQKLKGDFRSKEQKKLLPGILRSCRDFFMEVISGLCFGQSSAPEDRLVEMLLNIVFTEREEEGVMRPGTRELTPYKDDLKKTDESPVIRSFLLQLLLQHNTEKVKGHLDNYFEMSRQALTTEVVDLDLCLLCTQCFEDALDKELSSQPLPERLAGSVDLLQQGMESLVRSGGFTQRDMTLDLLEGVAKVRYALLVVADLLQQQVNEVGGASPASHAQDIHGAKANRLLEEARHVCTTEGINTIDSTGERNTTGPVVYLLKMIVRQYGFGCLKKVVERHQWVVPVELRQDEEKTVDPFVMYNPVYSPLREVVNAAAYGKAFDGLAKMTEALQPQLSVPLLLGVYEVVTLSHTSTLPSRQLLPEVLEKFNELILNCKGLSNELRWMARALIANEQGGPLAALRVSPNQPAIQRTMAAIVVHTAATLFSRHSVELLHPLVAMLTKPADLTRAYLPTMPEDMLPEARRIISGGQFYECPRGHPYFVGECGRPVMQATCNVCGSAIGGINHAPVAQNRAARTNDTTQTGHCLGHPTGRGVNPSPERSLSPAACNILRAIMHSALIWASCNSDSATEGLLVLVKPGVRPNELPEFFWGHLERDLQLVGRALGKNVEEAAIVVHLVIRHILTSDPTRSSITSVVKSLGARNAREEWEKLFNNNCIHPVLERVEDNLRQAMDIILKDDKQDHGPLFYLVYEHVPVVPGSLEPHLWGYRPRISLLHLSQALQQQKTKYPILREFVKEEPILRATQYLPDIVRLQHKLYDAFHHRLDRKDARGKTISQFLKERRSENVRNEYRQMVDSVQKAWSLVGDKLRDHARLRVDDEYLIPAIKLDTTLDYLIPTTTGPGACTFALVHYLVLVHNDFMERCRNRVTGSSKSEWKEHKVPLTHIHRCHLLDYERKLPSIILSHCHYSLRAGQGQDVTYDLPLLEKHILDQFILGRPTILVDIPQVVYRKDVYTAATFAAIREKVSKQVSLPSRVQHDILLELRSPDLLRRSLDVVDIVLGFLTSGGGKPKTRLEVYLKKLKMADKPFSEKAKEHCNLEHVLSLWQTLSVGLARMTTLSGQEPFDTIPTGLTADLTEEQEQGLDQCLRRFDLDPLLVTLYEFIETYVRHIDLNSNEKDWGLVDTLTAHLENNNLEGPPQLEELPDDITLAQTVATWKYVVYFQERQKQE